MSDFPPSPVDTIGTSIAERVAGTFHAAQRPTLTQLQTGAMWASRSAKVRLDPVMNELGECINWDMHEKVSRGRPERVCTAYIHPAVESPTSTISNSS